jgi:molybdate transport system ATP-binding protein
VIYLENGTLVDRPDSADQIVSDLGKLVAWNKRFPPLPDFDVAIGMRDIKVQYGKTCIIDGFTWEVKKGEAWALSGPNGAGKSTLLSLVTADNPQAYAQNLVLFDRKRGSGESIWDIKRRIGYVSPELHLYFKESGDVFSVVASGLFDTLGLFKKMTDTQVEQVVGCLGILGLSHISQRNFQQISSGEQRMVLLARALVKNPPLLILDEPCQGLDIHQIQLVKEVLDFLIAQGQTTLVYVSHYISDIPSSVQNHIRLQVPGK